MALVFEYAPHGSVEHALVTQGQFPLHLRPAAQPVSSPQEQCEQADSFCRCLRWSTEVCAGLAHLHARRILHRDLALRNLLFGDAYCIKVTDFGISRRVRSSSASSSSAAAAAAAASSAGTKLLYKSKNNALFPVREAAPEMFLDESSAQPDV